MDRIERRSRVINQLLLEMLVEKPGPESKAIVFAVDDDVSVTGGVRKSRSVSRI
jgi:hypothetical protein